MGKWNALSRPSSRKKRELCSPAAAIATESVGLDVNTAGRICADCKGDVIRPAILAASNAIRYRTY
jgi:hypothetical protein